MVFSCWLGLNHANKVVYQPSSFVFSQAKEFYQIFIFLAVHVYGLCRLLVVCTMSDRA